MKENLILLIWKLSYHEQESLLLESLAVKPLNILKSGKLKKNLHPLKITNYLCFPDFRAQRSFGLPGAGANQN